MTHRRDEARALHSQLKLKELRLQFEDGEEITRNFIRLDKPNAINFTVIFDEEPSSEQFQMTVSILKTDKKGVGSSGEFFLSPTATAVIGVVTLQHTPPRVTLAVAHLHEVGRRAAHPWHGGPGSYDAAVVLTTLDGVDSGESVATKYTFNAE